MKYWKWFWLVLGAISLLISVVKLVKPYELKVSDPISNVAFATGFELLLGIFGIICIFIFIKLVRKAKRNQNIINSLGKD